MRVTLLVVLASCGGGRVLSGPAVAGAGIVVEPRLARLELGELRILLEIDNQTERDLQMEPHLMSLVGPDGTIYPEAGGERTFDLAGNRHRRIRVRFEDLDWKLEHAPGFYLRLDGFVLGDEPIRMPALPLGHPVADPDGKVRVRRLVTASTSEPTETTCAILPLGDDALTVAVRERLVAAGWTVMTSEGSLSSDARAQAAVCRTGDCIRELGGALGVQFLIGGSVAEVEGEKALTLRLMSVTDGIVTARANALIFIGAGEEAGAALDAAVETLVGMD